MPDTAYKSPLHETVSAYPTDFWNDSCSVEELTYAIEHGAVGATSNPTIVEQVLNMERHLWKDRIYELIEHNPSWSDEDVMGEVFEEIALKGAELLLPVFERENGMKGRLSIQTNPSYYRNVEAMVEQGVRYDSLARNMQVKFPATSLGIAAMEEATYRGGEHQRHGQLHRAPSRCDRRGRRPRVSSTRGRGVAYRHHDACHHHHGGPDR